MIGSNKHQGDSSLIWTPTRTSPLEKLGTVEEGGSVSNHSHVPTRRRIAQQILNPLSNIRGHTVPHPSPRNCNWNAV